MSKVTTILQDCESLLDLLTGSIRLGEDRKAYERKLDAWWDDIFSRDRLRNPPTNPATHADKGEPL